MERRTMERSAPALPELLGDAPAWREVRASLTYLSSVRRLAAAQKACDAAPKITTDER